MLKRNRLLIAWLLLAICIRIFSLFPVAVEKWYATGIYPLISQIQRILFGWIPFSIGDLLYAAVIIYLITAVFRIYKVWRRKHFNRSYFFLKLRKFITILLAI